MVFEVDNTTEKIIERLKDSIEGNLQGIHDDQASITKEISSLKNEISQEEVLDSIRDVRRDLNDISDKTQEVKRVNDDTIAMLDRVLTSLGDIDNKLDNNDVFDKILQAITDLEKKTIEIGNELKSIKDNNQAISDNVNKILNSAEDTNKKLDELNTREKSIISQIEDIYNKENDTLSQLEAIKNQTRIIGENSTQIINFGKTQEEKSNLIYDSSKNNGELIEGLTNTSKNNSERISKIMQMSEDNSKENEYQKEQIERITNYLRKPGIARFFVGMKGDKNAD